MAHKVFIDGEAGTTGLQIRERLEQRADITLVQVDPARRKDAGARSEALAEADVAILCLPDDAARETVTLAEPHGTKIIDASTAHRVAEGWVFGFAEMAEGQREAIAAAQYVSNPGCWSTCAIALIRPLVGAGLIDPASAPAISGVSGYTGGGKGMIAEYESGETSGSFLYGASQGHKHLPEIVKHGLLSAVPLFVPSVGAYAQGMAVAVQLPAMGTDGMEAAEAALKAAYAGERFVSVVDASVHAPRVMPQRLNGTNTLELSVHGNPATGAVTLIGVLDNLGKGASGAAVQNLNIMLGCDEAAGLQAGTAAAA
ncbi:N-acetyl-gamma-glutamyl-phosphate reductase [Alloyangia pacifica]|uniref:N-acetyl-gamma-glutamyl-phosphate reductase n=1 Tax=Alloyangia pacifica TaxID=311180 RepID=A0A2U8HAV2_9RHOB|nr:MULTISPECIES: N-acetyl-gamma-glutamyl-phosphate reductase [Roseobacteraceae]AWI82823.1 N-acetyl-gamma-glutamyl-phosphate reductase [Alloyangia pacifica]NDV48147.1 N-acetyl-gamma-glutamyl-phosphate reductase [Salipiger sp. PrR003]